VKDIFFDCDSDALLIKIEQVGAACHTNNKSCFYRRLDLENYGEAKKEYSSGILYDVYSTIIDRKENPKEGSYTNYLFDKGIDKTLKKVGEESAEVIIAAKNSSKPEIIYEVSDLCYHLSVLMAQTDVKWQDIFNELGSRREK
jgi:phosphoribosyl-ATP pyrophosphohydrolase/phosphoribosyl-AMP cyclohydrolase